MSQTDHQGPVPEVKRRRRGPDWWWKVLGVVGIGQPIIDRERMYGDDPQNDPYQHDFGPNHKDRT